MAPTATADGRGIPLAGCCLRPGAEFAVAIDNKGLWPNLTLLPDREIAAVVYNHPSHGMGPDSGVELWCSTDEGRSFRFRSLVSDVSDVPGGIRMNHAVGLSDRGELLVLVSGYHPKQSLPLLPVQVCVSGDQGRTWARHTIALEGVPFGNVLKVGAELLCPMYRSRRPAAGTPKQSRSFLACSTDSGRSWAHKADVAEGVSETFLMSRSDGVLVATGRTQCVHRLDDVLPHGSGEKLFASRDGGRTWDAGRPVSPQGQENAHLLELRDGRILYCFTSRIPGLFGVVYRISEDGGDTWSVSRPLVTIPATDWHKTDCGYPSSVQAADGTVVTAYYFGPKQPEFAAETTPWHQRYHMGVARWRP